MREKRGGRGSWGLEGAAGYLLGPFGSGQGGVPLSESVCRAYPCLAGQAALTP